MSIQSSTAVWTYLSAFKRWLCSSFEEFFSHFDSKLRHYAHNEQIIQVVKGLSVNLLAILWIFRFKRYRHRLALCLHCLIKCSSLWYAKEIYSMLCFLSNLLLFDTYHSSIFKKKVDKILVSCKYLRFVFRYALKFILH